MSKLEKKNNNNKENNNEYPIFRIENNMNNDKTNKKISKDKKNTKEIPIEIVEEKKIAEPDQVEVIDLNSNNEEDKLSESLQKLLLENKEFAKPVIRKKENKLFTDYHYSTFKNAYAENTCYINVIIHLLNTIEELREFLISLYEIDLSNKKYDNNKNKDKKKDEEIISYDKNDFLVSIGKILKKYHDNIGIEENDNLNRVYKLGNLNKIKNNNITVINTLEMRKILEQLSDNRFPLNTIADPVELFTFILDILNENLNEDTHKSFYLELIDEYSCEKKRCHQNIRNKYDKDNFMYHIYIDEILKYIEKENIKVKDYKNKLFEFSYNLFLSENTKICEKCKTEMTHNLICNNCPNYILINCVWKQSNPIVDDVMTIFFLISLKDELNNLFVNPATEFYKKNYYYLLGFILYSFTLSHYIICEYNCDKEVFILLDDEIVKEYHNLNELIDDISVGILKENGKAFFYPVMLIYTKEKLYENKNINSNKLNEKEYQNIIKKCNEAMYEFEQQNELKEEMKIDNYQELIKQQQEIEDEIKRKSKYKTEIKIKKRDNLIEENKTEIKKKISFEEDKENQKQEEAPKNLKEDEEERIRQKIGLEKINQNKIVNILKDIKGKGQSLPENFYLGDLMKQRRKSNSKSKKKNKNEDNNNENKNNHKKYQSGLKHHNNYERNRDNSKNNRENKGSRKKSKENNNILKETNNLIQQNNVENYENKKNTNIRRKYLDYNKNNIVWKNREIENNNNKNYKDNNINNDVQATVAPTKKRFHRQINEETLLGKKVYNNNYKENSNSKEKNSKFHEEKNYLKSKK